MDVNFRLLPEAVAIERADSKQDILTRIAQRFSSAYGLDPDGVFESLEEREKLGSTGFGRGVALPHARIEGINRPVAVLLKLEAPVDFDAADDMPVDLVIGLLSPVNAGATHLHALAAVSRMMRDEATHEALSAAASAEAIYAMISNVSDRDVA